MTRKLIGIGLIVVWGLVACGKKGGGNDVSVAKADADAVNATVPADLKAKVEFEAGSIKDDFGHHSTTYSMVVP